MFNKERKPGVKSHWWRLPRSRNKGHAGVIAHGIASPDSEHHDAVTSSPADDDVESEDDKLILDGATSTDTPKDDNMTAVGGPPISPALSLHATDTTQSADVNLDGHGATVQSSHSTTVIKTRQMFALIIAIDEYQNPEIQNLRGCENDGKNFETFLNHNLHVPSEHIKKLVNADATRAAILEAIRAHFTENDAVRPGDAMIFFYAGHGSRVDGPDGWASEQNKVETIVPHDEGKHRSKTTYGIPDYTFDALMRELSVKKSNNITAIFDSCHSGGMARSNANFPRTFRTDISPSPLPPDLDREILTRQVTNRHGQPVAGFLCKAQSSHVLLAACKQQKDAFEDRSDSQQPSGLFTTALLKVLEECDMTQMTYTRLIELISHGIAEHQQPQCEGEHKDRIIFDGAASRGIRSAFKVSKEDDHVYVDAGTIIGVTNGAQFTVTMPPGYQGSILQDDDLILVAEEVHPYRCRVRPKNEQVFDSLPTADLKAFISAFQPKMDVRLCWSTNIASSSGDLVVHCSDKGNWRLERFDPLTKGLFNRMIDVEITALNSPTVSERLTRILDAASLFNHHLYQCGNRPLFYVDGGVQMQLHQLAEDTSLPVPNLYRPTGDDFVTAAKSLAVDPEESTSFKLTRMIKKVRNVVITDTKAYYGLTLVNNTGFNLFPYVLYFDPGNYSIEPWYLPPSRSMDAPLRTGSELPIGYGSTGVDAIEFTVPDKIPKESGFLKVYISTKYVNIEVLKQESPFTGSARGAKIVQIPVDDMWDAQIYILTCQKGLDGTIQVASA